MQQLVELKTKGILLTNELPNYDCLLQVSHYTVLGKIGPIFSLLLNYMNELNADLIFV